MEVFLCHWFSTRVPGQPGVLPDPSKGAARCAEIREAWIYKQIHLVGKHRLRCVLAWMIPHPHCPLQGDKQCNISITFGNWCHSIHKSHGGGVSDSLRGASSPVKGALSPKGWEALPYALRIHVLESFPEGKCLCPFFFLNYCWKRWFC